MLAKIFTVELHNDPDEPENMENVLENGIWGGRKQAGRGKVSHIAVC